MMRAAVRANGDDDASIVPTFAEVHGHRSPRVEFRSTFADCCFAGVEELRPCRVCDIHGNTP